MTLDAPCAGQSPIDGGTRSVSSYSIDLTALDYGHPATNRREGTFVLVMSGLVTFEVSAGLWMVPPQCALWIPGGMERSVRGVGDLKVYALFIAPDVAQARSPTCCTMTASPLLRELVMTASRLPTTYDQAGPAGRLIRVILDEIAAAPIEHLHLPMPADRRLRQIADALLSNPADRATIGQWGRRIGMSERALLRLAPEQTGMSFGRWRQQFQVLIALERLSIGQSVQTVALDIRYESASSFITMFKKILGRPPAKYLAARSNGAGASWRTIVAG